MTSAKPAACIQASRRRAGVRLGTVGPGGGAIELEPAVEARICGVPGHSGVVRVPHRHQTHRPGRPVSSRSRRRPGRSGAAAPGGRGRHRSCRRDRRGRRCRRPRKSTLPIRSFARRPTRLLERAPTRSTPTTSTRSHQPSQIQGDRARVRSPRRAAVAPVAGVATGSRPSSRPSATDASAARCRGARACRCPPGRPSPLHRLAPLLADSSLRDDTPPKVPKCDGSAISRGGVTLSPVGDGFAGEQPPADHGATAKARAAMPNPTAMAAATRSGRTGSGYRRSRCPARLHSPRPRPTVPPSWRMVCTSPEPWARSAGVTRLSASVLVGEMVRPRPKPVKIMPGTCHE